MPEQDQDVIREFLIESHENLARLDQELLELERRPNDASLLASIFRNVHTIKGTCGFLAFTTLERITHQTENLLSQLRDGRKGLTRSLVSLILETIDATRRILASIESSGTEGADNFDDLVDRLHTATVSGESPATSSSEPVIRPAAEATSSGDSGVVKPREDAAKSSVADANVRVSVDLLDKLMDLVGELVLTRNQILQFSLQREDADLNAASQRLNLITTELQESVMKTRMQPIGVIWNKLPRMVRDMATGLGKQIRLETEGADTELDRTIIEAIKDPLVHLVRNACDHGVELPEGRIRAGKLPEGELSLRAYHEAGQVNIEIADDGAGLDTARIKQKAIEKGLLRPEAAETLSDREILHLIFQPGFSTAQAVTNLSGRGVGMDVVKSHIENIGGIVDIFSRQGEGTTVKLKIPLTLAIIPGLVVTSGRRGSPAGADSEEGERFVIPQAGLIELIRTEAHTGGTQIEYIHGTPVYRRRGTLLPVVHLNEILALESSGEPGAVNIVVLQAEGRQFGLVVDRINDTQEIVVKPLGKQLKGLSVYAGATIMGDGRVALILDVLGIAQRSGVLTDSRQQTPLAKEQATQTAVEQQSLLLFRTGSFERLAVPLSLVARLEEFPLRSIERAGGRQVTQYRDQILPLIALDSVLQPDVAHPDKAADPLQVIVFRDGSRSVGLVVDQILDAVEEAVTIRRKTARRGILGSAVVGKQVSDFLDLSHVIHTASEDWSQESGLPGKRTVLLAEPSGFSRGVIRSGLDMAGYRVLEADSVEAAIRALEQDRVDAVLTALDLPTGGGFALRAELSRRPEWRQIPVLALVDSPEQAKTLAEQPKIFHDCRLKFDRDAMLESLVRLASALDPHEAPAAYTNQEVHL